MTTKTLVEGWYDAHAESEEHRLDDGRLEFEVTKRVIGDCITNLGRAGLKILDIGGGPGKYGKPTSFQNAIVALTPLALSL
jgi:S-adenosylmethionine-dependent methyltransferase